MRRQNQGHGRRVSTSEDSAGKQNYADIDTLFHRRTMRDNLSSSFGKLVIAAAKGDLKAVSEKLSSCGLDPNLLTKDGKTVLHYAVTNNRIAVVKELLKHNADVSIQSFVNLHPAHGVVHSCHEHPLFTAAKEGCLEIAKILLGHNANPDQRTIFHTRNGKHACDKVALGIAVERLFIEIVQLLLDHNADVNVENRIHEPIIYSAIRCRRGLFCKRQTEILQLLCEHGVEVNQLYKADLTPLDIATNYGCHRKVELLLLYGADPNKKRYVENDATESPLEVNLVRTPLHTAANLDLYDVAELLLFYRAKLNARDPDGYSSLHKNILNCSRSRVAFQLIRHGIDVNIQSLLGKSTLSLIMSVMRLDCEDLCPALLAANYDLYQDKTWLLNPQSIHLHVPQGRMENLRQNLCSMMGNTLQLKEICRIQIRKAFQRSGDGGSILSKVDELIFPKKLKEYLKMTEYDIPEL